MARFLGGGNGAGSADSIKEAVAMKAGSEPLVPREVPGIIYDALVSSPGDVFNLIDRDFRILWTNYQSSTDDLIGKHCFKRLRGRNAPCKDDCPIAECFRTKEPVFMERRHTDDSGKKWNFVIRTYPVCDESGEVAYALKVGFSGELPDRSAELPGQSLTPRELQVLELISEGQTNQSIAGQLAISPHTVKSHVIHIFNKLGVSDRTQAAVLAARLQLI
jgi:DNA-binding CsgD family transcriptional regulator